MAHPSDALAEHATSSPHGGERLTNLRGVPGTRATRGPLRLVSLARDAASTVVTVRWLARRWAPLALRAGLVSGAERGGLSELHGGPRRVAAAELSAAPRCQERRPHAGLLRAPAPGGPPDRLLQWPPTPGIQHHHRDRLGRSSLRTGDLQAGAALVAWESLRWL